MGRASQQKGYRSENALVNKHKAAGIHAERVPLSGAVRYKGNGGDIDVYWNGKGAEPVVCEVKARGNGQGFKQLETWMGEHQAMFLKRDRQDPMVLITWEFWLCLLFAIQSDKET